ncbi:MAG TPA: hypothetical protein VGF74_05985 [Thermoleophilaceae bacterium]
MANDPLHVVVPRGGQLWLSRPPFLLLTRVLEVDPGLTRITYEVLDRDGSVLTEPVEQPLEASWWEIFQPLVRRCG